MLRFVRLLFRWIVELFRGIRFRLRRQDGADNRPFYVIAHRGSPCREVENTIASFEYAVEKDGANAIEFDLCFTLDKQVIVWHDWDPNDPVSKLRESGVEPDVKYCCSFPQDGNTRRPVCDLMLHEVRECFGYVDKMSDERCEEVHIPTFEDLMQWARQKPQLKLVFLDIKVPEERIDLVPEMIGAIEDIIRRYPPTFRFVYETASRRVLHEMRRAAPDRDFTLDITPPPGFVLDPEEHTAVGPAIEEGNPFATPSRPRPVTFAPWTTHRRVIESDQRRRARHNSTSARVPVVGLVPFTINDPKEMRTLIALGVDGIQSDRPDILSAVARTMGRRLA